MIDLNNILGYLRGLLGFRNEVTRKRRADSDDIYLNSPTSKLRKISLASQMSAASDDDWISFSAASRRTSLNNISQNQSSASSSGQKPKARWTKPIDISDEDDDIIEVNSSSKLKSKFGKLDLNQSRISSTPISRASLNRSEKVLTIDITGEDKSRRILNGNSSWKSPLSNNLKLEGDNFLTPYLGKASSNSLRNRPSRSLTLEESCRLDEKQQYRKLLRNAAPNASTSGTPLLKSQYDSFSKCSAITGRNFSYGSTCRGKFLTDLAINGTERKSSITIDLSNEPSVNIRNGHTTKNRILKVLDKFPANEPVDIRDSSDEEECKIVKIESLAKAVEKQASIPKPDLEGTNSLKKIIDCSQVSSKNWISEYSDRIKSEMVKKISDARLQKIQQERCNTINNEIRTKSLEEDFKRTLKIKDGVIPVEEVEELVVELTDDQNNIVNRALYPKPSQEVLISKFSLDVTRADIQTLNKLNWLNDEVINFYVSMLTDRSQQRKDLPKSYAFNTFFYPKLKREGPSSLRRWTKKVDIFAYDLIVVPVHLGMHWCMAIIDFRSKSVEYYDSMGGENEDCLKLLIKYLQHEHRDKKGSKFDTSDWNTVIKKGIPQQMNGSDCGMFSCMFAEYITRNAKINFTQRLMPYFRRKMVYEIVTGNLLL